MAGDRAIRVIFEGNRYIRANIENRQSARATALAAGRNMA
jgi:hypothetical protein